MMKPHHDSDVTAGSLFSLYFTDDAWDLIAQETNRNVFTVSSYRLHAHPWEDAIMPKMKAFIGMLIAIGILHIPRLEMY